MMELSKGSTKLTFVRPDVEEPYYRGTRFDRSGIILSLEYGGRKFISQWFREYDPYKHDAVGGPAEEFSQIGYDNVAPGEGFLKTGVGLLERDGNEYDRFHLYNVIDEGKREFSSASDNAVFTHSIDTGRYGYRYMKKISIPEDGILKIEHSLLNTGSEPMGLYVYNHNFFVLDGAATGKDTVLTLPFRPEGHWRENYDCVALTENGVRFSRDLRQDEKVFMGDLKGPQPLENYSFRLENIANGLSVEALSDATMEYAVFWSNHEVSCLEPYTRLLILPGQMKEWRIRYRFGISE